MASISGRPWYEDYYKSCNQCSVASIPNVVYLPNGSTVRGTPHHRIFHIGNVRSGKDIKLYGIVDGFNDGQSVADFVADHLVNEILPLGHSEPHIMNKGPTDSDIKTLLCQTFKRVDNLYFSDYIGETLARRCAQQMGSYDQKNMDDMNSQINGFATALIALIYDNKLFVANLGDSRALLIKRVKNEWKVIKICAWHHPSDPDEAQRLADLGVDPNDVGPPSRCFGDFFRKWGYKEVPSLCRATGEPISAEVSVHGPYSLDESMRFLVLMNGGVVQTVIETDYEANVEVKVAGLVAKYSTEPLSELGKAVLNTLVREHQNAFVNGSLHLRPPAKRRDVDMLVIRLSQIHADKTERSGTQSIPEATLEHDIKEDPDSLAKEEAKSVQSYIDFSPISVHPLREQVLRNIEEIKKRYKNVDIVQLNEVDEEDTQL